ncbi:MAG: hypothetical protein SFU53_10655 [Terrimicrobiaceae bacterium]|nr:hypothetical protein [Terrimicrobiaceae bacterium]
MNPTALRTALLVTAAFVILIGAWITVIRIAATVPHQKLTREQESRLLEIREGRP